MNREELLEYKKSLIALSDAEKKERDLYLRDINLGKIQGPLTGFPSIDKPWLKWYSEDKIDEPYRKANIYDYFLEETKPFPNATLITYYGRKYTREDIKSEVEEWIRRFKALGLKKGDTVSFVMLNVPEAIFMGYALAKMGVISNRIKHDETGEGIKYKTELTKSKYVFASEVAFILKNVSDGIKDNETVEKVITLSLTESLPVPLQGRMLYDELKMSREIKQNLNGNVSINEQLTDIKNSVAGLKKSSEEVKSITSTDDRFVSYKDWKDIKFDNDLLDNVGTYEDVVAIVYTGGTTGAPKGVMLTNDNLNAMAHDMKNGEYDFDIGKTSLCILPPSIAYYFNSTHGNITSGVNVTLVSHFTPQEYPYLIKRFEPNIFMAGPILLENLRKANILESAEFMVAPISGGDKLYEVEEESDNEYIKSIGGTTTVHQGWGMSEGTAASSYAKTNAYVVGTVGIPFIDLTVSVFDYRTEDELTYNNVGELCVTGPTIMKGYFNNEEATNQVLMQHSDGKVWLHTDDLGYIDTEGRIFHRGRAKRMLTRSGNKVWLSEIEDLASKCSGVDKCSCVKMNDDVEREVPVLHIVLKNSEISLEQVVNEINTSIASELPESYIPKYYVVRDDLPYSEVNKKCDFKKLEEENILDTCDYEINNNIIIKRNSMIRERKITI